MTKTEASQLAQDMLRQHGQAEFEVSLGNAEDYAVVGAAFVALGCRTEPNGEFFVLKVFPAG